MNAAKRPRAPSCPACGSKLPQIKGIGGELRNFRLSVPMSQTALAEVLGFCRMTISNVESGTTRASFKLLQRFNALKEKHERNRNGLD